MSIVCLSHVMRHSEAQLGARLVLFVLAEHAHDDGSESYPSVQTLVERTRLSRRAVQSGLRRLEDDGMIVRDGFGQQGQTKYRILMGGADSAPPAESGGEADDKGGRSSRRRGGVAASPEPSFNRPSEPSERECAREPVAEVWEHYQQTIPNGGRYKLDAARRQVIVAALRVRTPEECCRAIDGLARSEYHVSNGYVDVKYALKGGGRDPRPDATIDRMMAMAAGKANGSSGRRVFSPDGRTWDQLSSGEKLAAQEAISMGLDPAQERSQDGQEELVVTGRFTAANFLDAE